MFAQTQAEYGRSGLSGGGKAVRARCMRPTHKKVQTATVSRKRTRLSRHALYQSIMGLLLHSRQKQLAQTHRRRLHRCGSNAMPARDDGIGIPGCDNGNLTPVSTNGPDGLTREIDSRRLGRKAEGNAAILLAYLIERCVGNQ